jgi:hypothetical protein
VVFSDSMCGTVGSQHDLIVPAHSTVRDVLLLRYTQRTVNQHVVTATLNGMLEAYTANEWAAWKLRNQEMWQQ